MGSASVSRESDTSSSFPRIQCSQSHGSLDACGVCPGLPLLADAACLRLCDVPLDIFVQQESLPLERLRRLRDLLYVVRMTRVAFRDRAPGIPGRQALGLRLWEVDL